MGKEFEMPAPRIAHVRKLSHNFLICTIMVFIGIGFFAIMNQLKLGENQVLKDSDSISLDNSGIMAAPELPKDKNSLLVLTIPATLLVLAAIATLAYRLAKRRSGEKKGSEEAQDLSELVRYIEKSFEEGQKEQEIKINVLGAGWKEKDLRKAMAKAKTSQE